MMKYSVVIPTYNHCDDLLKPCVESIFKYTDVTDIELIISANGCKDNTLEYLGELNQRYKNLGISDNLKITWDNEPLGYSKACNAGIKLATTDLIVLLNNDTVLLEQPKNRWLNLLARQFEVSDKCGISCLIKSESEPAGHDFAIFFCVMIHRKVFDKIGLLSLDYGVGGGEDTEFSIECERAGFEVRECVEKVWSKEVLMYSGDFPIYHKGEGTMHDKSLVPTWDDIFLTNSLTLARKYNPKWYQWRLSNYSERGVFFKGDSVFPREAARYQYAADNMIGKKVFELGCSSGFGIQFFPRDIEYHGLDYDKNIIKAAIEQDWGYNANFIHGDINTYPLDQYDTIVAFEVIEHLANGLEIVEKLKQHCKRLIITVPRNENPGEFSPHHLIHNLNESKFTGFKFKYVDSSGIICDQPKNYSNPGEHDLLLAIWDRSNDDRDSVDLSFLNEQDKNIYKEVIETNQYNITTENMRNRTVIDIGTNIGVFSLLAAKLGAKRVYSVEPVSKNYNQFLSNIYRTKLTMIKAYKNLVSNVSGDFMKVSTDVDPGANSMYNVVDGSEVVQTITLNDIMREIDDDHIFLKLDCEGAEYDILLNSTVQDMARINDIVLEIHTDLHPVYKGREIIENKLKEFGFKNTKNDQIYFYDIDGNGNKINWREAPYCNQHWIR